MNSRERVRNTLDRLPVDRIPNGLGGAMNAGLHLDAYEKLKVSLGRGALPSRVLSFEANAVPELDVLKAIGADMISVGGKLSPARLYGPGYEAGWKDATLWGRHVLIPKT